MANEISAENDFLGLRAKREALGLTLKEVFVKTRVSVVNLEAIERGCFHELPAPIYTRNFVKTYCGALNVDAKPTLEAYENYLISLKTRQAQPMESEPEKDSPPEKIKLYKIYLWTASLIILTIAIIFFVSQQHRSTIKTAVDTPKPPADISKLDTNEPAKTPAAVAEQKTPAEIAAAETSKQNQLPIEAKQETQTKKFTVEPRVEERPFLYQTEKIKKLLTVAPTVNTEESNRLLITATEETWLRITTDQKPPFQVLLKPGEKFQQEGVRFELDIGNAGGVKINYRGKIIEKIGKSGQVVHISLPEQKIER